MGADRMLLRLMRDAERAVRRRDAVYALRQPARTGGRHYHDCGKEQGMSVHVDADPIALALAAMTQGRVVQ